MRRVLLARYRGKTADVYQKVKHKLSAPAHCAYLGLVTATKPPRRSHKLLASLPQFGFGVVVHQHPRGREGHLHRQAAEAGRAVELTRLHGRVADALELRE